MDVTGKEMVINRKQMALKKVEKIKNGYSAFAESKEVTELVRKELQKQKIDVHEDVTEVGSWFMPVKPKSV
ncbi:hypothetical protein JCM9140_4297 [Halalkalibacter wakoensis JCM 9140]|uniref:Uncharacterized protein n=1 Tax=Halalkalibacter wakoensis JCM 9140 TaxID=1236970 RepID=W4Q8U3_9BACI|nr:hypothetical protein [Halalkalibacter wakoensis]GAE28103.1 hypothetical protein JCM9140_4297 [Halalkalibacter wakoensis JCM 9140]